MPRSAIASGCVDFILPPEGIAQELARISRLPYVVSAEATAPTVTAAEPATKDGFKQILNILCKAHGVDFALYKISTVQRRTMRRMLLNKVDGYDDYFRYLGTHPEEVENLYQDILINVTSFFRHPEAFEVLKKKILPKLTERRSAVPEPHLILDENLSIRAANPRFHEFFNLTPRETEGYFIYDLGGGQWNTPSLRTQLENLLTDNGAVSNFEIEREFPDIGRKTMLLNARQVRPAPGARRLIVLAISDITRERQVTMERDQLLVRERAARLQAEDANHLKDEFLAICSHELRAPLAAIQGWAEMLAQGGLDEHASQRGLETILRNVRAQTQIIEDLLDVSRVIAGKLTLRVRAINPAASVESTLELVRPSINDKHLKLTTTLDREVVPFFADSVRLQQIIWNLLSNAVKFTPEAGSIAVRLRQEVDQVAIIVEDTGVGIKPELLPVIFDLFRQADSRTARSYGGLGLGLAIVRLLVELHGGTVRAESVGEGKGSRFTVKLPRRPPGIDISDEPETRIDHTATGSSPSAAAQAIQGLRVLVVDDDPDSRGMLKTALTADGCRLKDCSSASEALSTLKEWLPDVIVSDIGMPSEDGYSLIQMIRELPAAEGGNIPAIALTGYATLDDHKKALQAGYQLHVAKPVELDILATAVNRVVEMSKQGQ